MTTSSAPLDQPLYGASFGQAIARFFKKYATFSGRASRSEYWWFFLFDVIVSAVISIVGSVMGFVQLGAGNEVVLGPGYWFAVIVSGIWGLATLIPRLAIIWRRLHDTNKSGGFFFLSFIPFVGSIILIILLILDTNPAGARFDKP